MAVHKWSGWPGAICLKCGVEDPWEAAIGMNWYDPYSKEWDDPEHEALVKKIDVCNVEDEEWEAFMKKSEKK